MKKVAILLVLIIIQSLSAVAISSGDAKQDWIDARKETREKQQEHRDAKIDFAADQSSDNRQAVIDTGKEVLHSALDESEAWLLWKEAEVDESDAPDDLKDTIKDDIEKNLDTIDGLRDDVNGIVTQLDLGLVFLKMVGKYLELLTDVARNSGKVWVHIGNTFIDDAEDLESKLRNEAEGNDEALAKLDAAKSDIDEAQENVDSALEAYEKVVLPGTPLFKFAEGNQYMRVARANLLSAHANLNQAYRILLRGDADE